MPGGQSRPPVGDEPWPWLQENTRGN
jgi:hypothetical protein